MSTKVVVAGSRNFTDYELLCRTLDEMRTPAWEIVSGGARGADLLGERYAIEHNLSMYRFPAEWNKYGKSAGHKRNRKMADFGDALVAFWNGNSPGTRSMIEYMREQNKPVRVVNV